MGLVFSGFGLSAFLFSFISRIFFPGDTSSFLLILAVGTACPMIMGHFLVRPIPFPRSSPPPDGPRPVSAVSVEATSPLLGHDDHLDGYEEEAQQQHSTNEEISPLMSRRRALLAGDVGLTNVSGKKLAKSTDFWLLFSILSLCTLSSILCAFFLLLTASCSGGNWAHVYQQRGIHVPSFVCV